LPFEGVYDYGHDGVMRSVEDSLQRLGVHRIDVLLIHDVDVWTHGSEEARLIRFREVMEGGYRAMLRLREEGVVRAIGAGINEVQACEDFARAGDFDCFLLAGRYTLLEQGALDTLLPLCAERDMALLIGGPYNTGILATGAVPGAYYNYAPAPPEIMDRVRRIEAVCARHGARLASAALQFPLGHPNVATLIPGARSPEEVEQNRAIFEADVPADLWAELKREGLLREDAPTPA
jgi:D-threo-aldose 1-dehydrogenase